MKNKKRWLLLLALTASLCAITACNDTSESSSETNSIASDSQSQSFVGGDSDSTENENPTRQVNIVSSALYNQYFTGDSVTVTCASLEYSGALQAESFEIISPDGSTSQDASYTFTKAGKYQVKYYLELYAETVYGVQEITVSDWADSYKNIDMVSADCIDETYIGNSFVAPDTATLSYYGTEVEGTFLSVTAPNGDTIEEKQLSLSAGGTYKINYQVEIGGRTFVASKEVKTTYNCYAVSGEKSVVEYGYDCIRLELAEGEEFIVNKIVDLSTFTKDDTLFSLRLDPEKVEEGLPDAMMINIKLTDVYNPENYVIIQIHKRFTDPGYREWADDQAYLFVGGAEQVLGGLNNQGQNATSGKEVNFSMVGNPAGDILTVSFDYASRQIHTPNGIYGSLVGDLDDPNNYTGTGAFGTELWNGFTTGEAYISVYAEEYHSTNKKAVIEFLDICGFGTLNYKTASFTDGVDNGVCEMNVETVLPEKSLTFEGQSYTATAVAVTSPDGVTSENLTSFTPDKEGAYSVIYTATVNGETVYAVYRINSVKTTFALNKPLLEQYKTGAQFSVPTVSLFACGEEYETNFEVILPDTTKHALANFTLTQTGEYTLRYYSDYSALDYEVTFVVADKPAYTTGGTVNDNAAIPGGWDSGMLGVTLAKGEKLTVNEIFDYTGESYENKLFATLSLCALTGEEYKGKNLYITLTNAENANESLRIRYAVQSNGVVYFNAYYIKDGVTLQSSNTWGATNGAGSELSYVLTTQSYYIGAEGFRYKINGTNCAFNIENFFTKAVVTLESDTGISLVFADLCGKRAWLSNEHDVKYYANGQLVHSETVEGGATITYAETPVSGSKVFVGWFETEADAQIADPANAYNREAIVNGPLNLYAGFADYIFNAPTGLKTNYKAETELTIPTASFTLATETVAAEITVKDPDGASVTLTANKFTPTKIGQYKLIYTAQIGGETQTKEYTFFVMQNLSYATWDNPNTTVNTNTDIPGGWGEGMLGVNIAAGDTITLAERADLTGKTLASSYLAYQISFSKMTKAEYEDRELTIRYTNPEDPTDYVEFRNVCDTDVSNQVYVYVSYSKGGSTTWGQSYFGNDVSSDYGMTLFTIKLGTDGTSCQWFSAVATCANQIGFTSAIVTLDRKSVV